MEVFGRAQTQIDAGCTRYRNGELWKRRCALGIGYSQFAQAEIFLCQILINCFTELNSVLVFKNNGISGPILAE
jgi:hypothetical protein